MPDTASRISFAKTANVCMLTQYGLFEVDAVDLRMLIKNRILYRAIDEL